MSAQATSAGMHSPGTERGGLGPGVRPAGVKTHWRLAAAVGLLLMGALTLFSAEIRSVMVQEAPPRPAIADGFAAMPSRPTDGVLTMIIPPGAAADQQAGGRGYEMPSVISLTLGDTIVIRNDDDTPHMILYTFLMPGETDERTFMEVGSEVYSSGCGLHAASYHNFTTIFVSESGMGKSAL